MINLKTIKAVLAAAALMTLCGCAESNTAEIPVYTEETASAAEISDIPDGCTLFEKPVNAVGDTVVMEIVSADNMSAKFKVTNNLDRSIDLGYCVLDIQKKINNDWYSLPYTEQTDGFIGHANVVGGQCSRDFERNWEGLYGKLDPGGYRAVISFTEENERSGYFNSGCEYYLSAEFEIL